MFLLKLAWIWASAVLQDCSALGGWYAVQANHSDRPITIKLTNVRPPKRQQSLPNIQILLSLDNGFVFPLKLSYWKLDWSRHISGRILTQCYRLNDWRIGNRFLEGAEILSSLQGTDRHVNQLVSSSVDAKGTFSVLKWLGRETDHPLPSSAKG